MYKENPKTKGSGIICAIPQKGRCPMGCDDCFFQSGRSYLEPLEENLPNMPTLQESIGRVVRVNDGNDSNIDKENVIKSTQMYQHKFFNTSIPTGLEDFNAPVVLTINPGKMTDNSWHKLEEIPKNLMFVRIRTNCWNLENVVLPAVKYYTEKGVPVVLTFMAYFDKEIPEKWKPEYIWRKRTLNPYNAITTSAWRAIMSIFMFNKFVYSCGKIEGEIGDTHCSRCGNCLREYFNTAERMKKID